MLSNITKDTNMKLVKRVTHNVWNKRKITPKDGTYYTTDPHPVLKEVLLCRCTDLKLPARIMRYRHRKTLGNCAIAELLDNLKMEETFLKIPGTEELIVATTYLIFVTPAELEYTLLN